MKRLVLGICLLFLLVAVGGCKEEEGALESAGKAVDSMFQDAEDSVNDALTDAKRALGLQEPGPVEKLIGESGRPVDEMIWKAEAFFDETLADVRSFLTDVK